MNSNARPGIAAGVSILTAALLILVSSQSAFAAGAADPAPISTPSAVATADPATPPPTDPVPAVPTTPADPQPADQQPADPAPTDPVPPSALLIDPAVVSSGDPVVPPAGLTNTPPVAVNDLYLAEEDSTFKPGGAGMLANDTDVDGDTLTLPNVVTFPSHALMFMSAPDGQFTYVPQDGFTGVDSFTYKAFDGTAYSAVATVTIDVSYNPLVQHPPVTNGELYLTPLNTQLHVVGPGLFANDVDLDGDPIVAGALVDSTTHGTLSAIAADGSFTYTPDTGYVGKDEFSYRVSDGNLWSFGKSWVEIDVADELNPAPIAVDDTYSITSGTTLSVGDPGFFANDTDNGLPISGAQIVLYAQSVQHGKLDPHTDGSFSYLPNPGFVGTDSFSYLISDGVNLSNVATVTITVTAGGPPVVIPPTTTPPSTQPSAGDPCSDVTGAPIANCGTPHTHKLAFTGSDTKPAVELAAGFTLAGIAVLTLSAFRRRRQRV